ncbi:S-adenosylmethionine synthetase [Natronococcus pandeyae]|uniref:S-adenosylmethionine synthetase n=1 Tax=Natronococcus pandeyae TaxID=2055836 RepID=A0A8J8TNB4_9EURY|nr:methionine adenosyltransferase [Natronococcus pandeyae]TYL36486.1 S-adenosylmethionine synthetase [Natronococcus pandeyae]
MSEYPVNIASVDEDPIQSRPSEFVERRGIGHPDTICDGIAEAISRALSRRYREAVGHILHHNTDSVLLIAGDTTPRFGGGELTELISVHLGGQATTRVNGTTIPVNDIARGAASDYLESHFDRLPMDFVEITADLNETSSDLRALFEREHVLANDTSVGVGYAPLSETERIVKTLEPRIWQEIDAAGKDVKIMASRTSDELHVIVATAILSSKVADIDEYLAVKEEIRRLVDSHVRSRTDRDVRIDVNAADDPDEGDVCISETGLSAESGDDGGVGRGNRINGLITPHRPMSIEATAGKNPVTHVGKLYNVVATRTADRIATDLSADFAEVLLLSEIGTPVGQPRAVDVKTSTRATDAVETIVREEVDRTEDATEQILGEDIGSFLEIIPDYSG